MTGFFLSLGSKLLDLVGANIFKIAKMKFVIVLIKLLSAILSSSFISNLRNHNQEVFVEEIH